MIDVRRYLRLCALCAAALVWAAAAPPPEAPVADAAMRGERDKVRALLREGADVNAAQGDGMTALHWAAVHGDAELLGVLIYAGARVEAVTRNGNYTALHLASRAGQAAAVKTLLKAGANVDARTTSGGATPLHLAAAQGDPATISALLDGGAELDARESAWDQTPLMWAAAYDRLAALELLIARGAGSALTSKVEDIPERERADRAAAQQRNRRMAALRAAEQPRPQQGTPEGGGRAAGAGEAASGAGAAAEADRARAQGADSARTSGAERAGSQAADSTQRGATREAGEARGAAGEQGRGEGAQARAGGQREGEAARGERGDNAEARPAGAQPLSYSQLVGKKGGLTPLLFAARQGNVPTVEALLEAGADINQVSDGDGTSPLLMATINGHFDLAMLLLLRGADPNLASEAGATPLYTALNVQWSAKSLYPQPTAHTQQKTTYLDLMKALLDAGADPNVRLTKHLWYMSYNFDLLAVNTIGATPFWRAAYATDVPAMRLLIERGADPNVPTSKPPEGRRRGDDAPEEDDGPREDPSGLPPVPVGGPGVWPIHAASGVGYGEGYAANAHRHAPDAWLASIKYLVEELGADVNARDHNGYSPLHHAAARGDNELILYLVEKGADVTAVSRRGQTTADMANGPVQRVPPFLETVALLEKLGSKNNNRCRSC